MRVLIAPVEIAGIAQGLYQGFCELGIESNICCSLKSNFVYTIAENESWVVRFWQFLGAWRSRLTKANFFLKPCSVFFHNLWGFCVLLWALCKFDSFIFLYGLTLTNTKLELFLLRAFRRKIIFIYVGSDSRPSYMDGGLFSGAVCDPIPSAADIYRWSRFVRNRVATQEKYADFVVCSPASAQYLTRPFIDWFAMGIPKSFPASEVSLVQEEGPVRILHAPSSSSVKGTSAIIQILENLRAKGYSIEVSLIEGRANSEVLAALQQCDFVIDQLYADTPLAAFAAEAAFFGKPAVVGGYFSEFVQSYICKENIPPSFFVLPSDVEMAVEKMIVDTRFRQELGVLAQKYVLERWSPKQVALRYVQLFENREIPSSWWIDPYSVHYVDGNGLDRQRAAKLVRELVESYGTSALMVTDKPELEQALLSLANLAGSGESGV